MNIFKNVIGGLLMFIVFFPAMMLDIFKPRTDFHGNKLDRKGNRILTKSEKKLLKDNNVETIEEFFALPNADELNKRSNYAKAI